MTSVMPGRRRAEEFAALVEGRAQRTSTRDAGLLELVEDLRTVPGPTARPEFVASLRAQLMAEADVALAAGTDTRLLVPARTGRERRVAVAAGALALVGATTSVAVAAQDALPGEALYPVKRALESAETSLEVDSSERAAQVLSHAYGRLAEASALARMESAQSRAALPRTLDDFSVQADEGADLVLDEYADTGDQAIVEDLQGFVASSMDRLAALESVVPASAAEALNDAVRVLADIDARARAACPTCTGTVLEIPESLLLSFESAAVDASVAPSRIVLERSPDGSGTTGTATPAPEQEDPIKLVAPELDVEDHDDSDDTTKQTEPESDSPLRDLTDALVDGGTKESGTSLDPLLDPLQDALESTDDLLEP